MNYINIVLNVTFATCFFSSLSIIFCGGNAIQVMKEAQNFYYSADVQIAN